jgi:hypothetical protein
MKHHEGATLIVEYLKFVASRRMRGIQIPDRPFFDTEETTAWFLDRLVKSRRYLEFGTGGSTFVAAKLGINFIAVESDLPFLTKVQDTIRAAGHYHPAGQTYHHADIGRTGPWGYPIGELSAQRRQTFRHYSDPPPECFESGVVPDLVLVDGRFRVACALKALQMLREQARWSIVVDDYADRPQYHVIADFAELDRYAGRMAVFTAAKDVSSELLGSAIRSYEQIPT